MDNFNKSVWKFNVKKFSVVKAGKTLEVGCQYLELDMKCSLDSSANIFLSLERHNLKVVTPC
jgi:hypothetical protein